MQLLSPPSHCGSWKQSIRRSGGSPNNGMKGVMSLPIVGIVLWAHSTWPADGPDSTRMHASGAAAGIGEAPRAPSHRRRLVAVGRVVVVCRFRFWMGLSNWRRFRTHLPFQASISEGKLRQGLPVSVAPSSDAGSTSKSGVTG